MVRIATKDDSCILAEMAVRMWDSHSVDELEKEFIETLDSKYAAFFIKYVNSMPVGFAQCGLRTDYVEGTESSPVGYLEGIFVKEDYRKSGYAKELLSACEMWAKNMGCTEFASDCELDNIRSFEFHIAMGFEEANRIICFKKRI
jgi:aminoglycoside 6'-N-acetyltransferase I